MPRLKEWKSKRKLLRDLKRYRWRVWFSNERKKKRTGLEEIIRDAVGGNTFRAFRCNGKNKPSEVFREWAQRALSKRTLDELSKVRSQRKYDEWLWRLVRNFQKEWNSKMRPIPYGPHVKLVNLLVKFLCTSDVIDQTKIRRFIWFLHVPLDSYTIAAVRKIVAVGPIRKNATMGFIKSRELYDTLQLEIRTIARKAKVPPIALDCLAWDSRH